MSNVSVFIFDEIFKSMIADSAVAKLEATGVNLHVIDKKCRISDYPAIKDPDTRKIVCINPDFVDWKFGADELKAIPGLQSVISSSDNISWLDVAYAKDKKIHVRALKNLESEYAAVTEYAITMLMSLARKIPQLQRDQYPLDYSHDFIKYQGIDIRGKKAAIIGLGNIGSAIAERCAELGMNVAYWSRSEKPHSHYQYREIDDLLKDSDVIFPTLKPNEQTKQLLPNKRLEQIATDSIVVSVVSGLIDNDYLAERVSKGTLFGFGFGADPGTFSNYSGNTWAIPDYAWATKTNMHASYNQFFDIILSEAKR